MHLERFLVAVRKAVYRLSFDMFEDKNVNLDGMGCNLFMRIILDTSEHLMNAILTKFSMMRVCTCNKRHPVCP